MDGDACSTITPCINEDIFSQSRRCCKCRKLFPMGKYSKCSRCKVYTYCSQECQKLHWKVHKRYCRAQINQPIYDELAITSNRQPDTMHLEMHERFKYIILVPGCDSQTKEEFYETAIGVQTDEALDSALASWQEAIETDSSLEDWNEVLRSRYNWPNGIQISSVPGFNEDYNGVRLLCFRDELFRSSSVLEANLTAAFVTMQDPDNCKGTFVFCAQKFDDNNVLIGNVGISRKSILDIAEYSLMCSKKGAVPDRVHFENIRRAEALQNLRSEKFQFV